MMIIKGMRRLRSGECGQLVSHLSRWSDPQAHTGPHSAKIHVIRHQCPTQPFAGCQLPHPRLHHRVRGLSPARAQNLQHGCVGPLITKSRPVDHQHRPHPAVRRIMLDQVSHSFDIRKKPRARRRAGRMKKIKPIHQKTFPHPLSLTRSNLRRVRAVSSVSLRRVRAVSILNPNRKTL